MGGTVKKVAQAAATIASPVVSTVTAAKSLVGGEGLKGAALAPVKNIVSGVKAGADITKGLAQDVGALPQDPVVPNIAADDPAAKAESDRLARARAKRQAEVDILTGTPGRGGTILTDNYNYQV